MAAALSLAAPSTALASSTSRTAPSRGAASSAAPSRGAAASSVTAARASSAYVHRISTRDPVVFVTVDDGVYPDAVFASLVRSQHLPVSLFLTSSEAARHLAYFRGLQAAGAVIEDHTIDHKALTTLGAAERDRQICGAARAEKQLFGERPSLLRPPYGDWSRAVNATASTCGIHAVIGWDAVMPESGPLQTWNGTQRLHAGDIVLLHFLPGLGRQVQRLLRLIHAQHLHVALLEHYI
jgi:peptidoglycan/xylan/chitin deacetylase (PgdA/CDA1 family)